MNGGWWHDARILAATGDGVEREEARAWEGWWNEKIVELVRLSMQQRDALCVLLTGRSEAGFSDLLRRIVRSKGLEFDLVGLKPAVGPNGERFRNTIDFKQLFLEALVETYARAPEIRVYEDRPRHVAGFRSFFADYNQCLQSLGASQQAPRPPIDAEVIQVPDISTNLDPVVEVAEVQHLVNSHNAIVGQPSSSSTTSQAGRRDRLMIRKTVFFTSYMVEPEDTKRLLSLVTIPPNQLEAGDLKLHANQIMIFPRPCPEHLLEKVGGLGAKMRWRVTATGSLENGLLWAARVEPVPTDAVYHTENPIPFVVLAIRKGARPQDAARIKRWLPLAPDAAFVFETTVGEKVMLRIEREDHENGDGSGSGGATAADSRDSSNLFPNNNHNNNNNKFAKRKHDDHNDRPRNTRGRGSGGMHYQNNHNHPPGSGRGGFRGGGGGASNRGYRGGGGGARGHFKGGGRGGGGGKGYRSLDDVAARDGQGPYGSVSYDDSFPALDQGLRQIGQQPQFGGVPPPPPQQQQQQHQGGAPSGWPAPGGGGGGPNLQNFY